ncbi:MAG TPA: RlmE family RNA methyltransferase [Gammaproteobacteria bacterium]|nr:RlmE family RNA methyltransferase [Gammaproteobacteria bacterium]
MAKSGSSRRWLREHETDLYVGKARREGYRSRSAYKLMEISARDKLFKPGMTVVDLGAAPGGWSQVAQRLVGPNGRVIATDLLDMPSVPGVTFISGDFTEPAVNEAVSRAVGEAGADLVLSDLAPNMSGMKAVDQARSMNLAECAFFCAQRVLKSGGSFLVKLFQGEGFEAYVRELRQRFTRVVIRKPQASRGRSSETYVLGLGYRPKEQRFCGNGV